MVSLTSSTFPSPFIPEYKLSNENGDVNADLTGSGLGEPGLVEGVLTSPSFLTTVAKIFVLELFVLELLVELELLESPNLSILTVGAKDGVSLLSILNSFTMFSNLLSLLSDLVGDTISVLS